MDISPNGINTVTRKLVGADGLCVHSRHGTTSRNERVNLPVDGYSVRHKHACFYFTVASRASENMRAVTTTGPW